MAGYTHTQQLHTNQTISANTDYTFNLPDFRTLTYFFLINGNVVGNGAVNIIVTLDSPGGSARLFFSRPIRTVSSPEVITIILPNPIIYIRIAKGALTSLDITDSIFASG